MNRFRHLMDAMFTGSAYFGCALVATALLVVLAPIVWKGGSAVVFQGTVEFRKLQHDLHRRGDPRAVETELGEVAEARRQVYDRLDTFEQGIRTEELADRAKKIYREFGREVRNSDISDDEQRALRVLTKDIRNLLLDAFESTDSVFVEQQLRAALEHTDEPRLKGTVASGLFDLARDYQQIVRTVDLGRRNEYQTALAEVREALRRLLGPAPGAAVPALIMDRYGATRMDVARKHLDELLWAEQWVSAGPDEPLRKVRIRREEQFQGTELAGLFPYAENNLHEMLHPRLLAVLF